MQTDYSEVNQVFLNKKTKEIHYSTIFCWEFFAWAEAITELFLHKVWMICNDVGQQTIRAHIQIYKCSSPMEVCLLATEFQGKDLILDKPGWWLWRPIRVTVFLLFACVLWKSNHSQPIISEPRWVARKSRWGKEKEKWWKTKSDLWVPLHPAVFLSVYGTSSRHGERTMMNIGFDLMMNIAKLLFCENFWEVNSQLRVW